MRKHRYIVIRFQSWRIAIFNDLEEKVEPRKEIANECSEKWEKTRRK